MGIDPVTQWLMYLKNSLKNRKTVSSYCANQTNHTFSTGAASRIKYSSDETQVDFYHEVITESAKPV